MKNIFLTGQPGVGKSTLIQKVLELVRARHPSVNIGGYWTGEIRNGSERAGFDVYSLDGEQGILARVGSAKKVCDIREKERAKVVRRDTISSLSRAQGVPSVGKYVVDLESFERIALPSLRNTQGKRLM